VQLQFAQPTRTGETELSLLTPLPQGVLSAQGVTQAYVARWAFEDTFQAVATQLHAALKREAHPHTARSGFCVAAVACNVLAVVKAALQAVCGTEKVVSEVSGEALAAELAATYPGMMIAITPEEWSAFRRFTSPQFREVLLLLARWVKLAAFCKHPRLPEKKTPNRGLTPARPYVAPARLSA